MKFTLIICTTIFAVIYSSPISILQSSTFITNLSQSLYLNLNPIFQNTLEQLKDLVQEFANQYTHRTARSSPPKPAEWFTQMFNGSDSISAQWNSHITDFFGNIPTIFENQERGLFDSLSINKKLHFAMNILLEKLRRISDKTINQIVHSMPKSNDIDSDKFYKDFQNKVSKVFAQTEIELNETIDDLIRNIFSFMNKLKG